MKKLEFYNLTELSKKESKIINGGDKFMKDLGWLIGYVSAAINDTFSTVSYYDAYKVH